MSKSHPLKPLLWTPVLALASISARAQQPILAATLPDAPSSLLSPAAQPAASTPVGLDLNPADVLLADSSSSLLDPAQQGTHGDGAKKPAPQRQDVDANGNPVALDRQQPQRILGFMPNFRSVSAGSKPHPPGWAYNFKVATHQAFDYSSFLFLGLTSITAEGMNSHPALGKGVGGFYAYTWRGFLDKTDGTYLSAWLLPSLLHEDTRYYPLGSGHKVTTRALYVISRQGVARTYSGKNTPNIAGLGGKVLTQVISRTYYPTGASDFSVLATKFGYSVMRDVAFSSIREFYPDIAAHYIKKHREKAARMSAADVNAARYPSMVATPSK